MERYFILLGVMNFCTVLKHSFKYQNSALYSKMDNSKLKKLIKNANIQLKTQPLSLINQKSASSGDQNSNQQLLGSIRCYACEDVRRQNYQLKQELYQYEQRNQKMLDAEKELAALKELYQLKCKQVELVRNELQNQQNKITKMEEKTKQFTKNSVENIAKKLKELQGGVSKVY